MRGHSGTRKPTLHDIAALAGVSMASVSRVINNVPPISDELRVQVESAIRQLRYTSKKSSTAIQPAVTALIGDLNNTYFLELVSGIQSVADQENILVNIVVNQADPRFATGFFRWLGRTASAGLIVCSSDAVYEDEFKRLLNVHGIPVVTIHAPANIPGIPSIRIDYEQAMAKVVQHAVKFRHTRIALLNGLGGAFSSVAKKRGVLNSLRKAGLSLRDEYYVEQPATVEGGFQGMNALLALPLEIRPTAVLATNDVMALGAIHATRSRDLSVPDDITVIGFDDIAMAAHANPPLTTISPPKLEMGARAMRKILEFKVDDPLVMDDFVVMESPLIVRESSGPYDR